MRCRHVPAADLGARDEAAVAVAATLRAINPDPSPAPSRAT
jgi:hypothetical protein